MPLPQPILDLMHKLQRMTTANGCTPSEAENAADRLQTLLQQHQVSIADIESKKLGEVVLEEISKNTDKKGRAVRFRRATIHYAGQIAEAFQCDMVWWPFGITFIGTQSDVAVCKFFFETTWPAIREEGKQQGIAEDYKHIHLIQFYDNFLEGAGIAIRRRLQPPVETEPTPAAIAGVAPTVAQQTAALVPIKQQEIKSFIAKNHPMVKPDKYKPQKQSYAGRKEGFEYGSHMPLSRDIGNNTPTVALN